MSIDTRGRQAAAGLHASVGHLAADPPPLGRPCSGRRVAALAAAAAAVVLLVAGGITALRDGDDGAAPVATAPGEVPRLLPSEVPAGLVPTGAVDLPVEDDSMLVVTMAVYGDPEADDPFAEGDLAVYWQPDEVGPPHSPERVRGPAAVIDEAGEVLIQWVEAGHVVTVHSRSLPVEEVRAVAESLVVDESGAELPDPPGDMALVGRAPLGIDGRDGRVAIPVDRPGHAAGWQREPTGSLAVATVAGDAGTMAAMSWFSQPGERTEVAGRPGWSLAGGEMLLWQHAPGVVAVVAGTELSAQQVRDVAWGLRPAPDAEWAELLALRAAHDAGEVEPQQATLGGGLPDGGTWRVFLREDGVLCVEVGEQQAGAVECLEPPDEPVVLEVERSDLPGGGRLVFGWFAVQGEQVLVGDAQAELASDGEATLFAIALPPGAPDGPVAVRLGGEVLAQEP